MAARAAGERQVVAVMPDGGHVSARVRGSGPAMLLIHGMLDTSACWDEVADRLAADHTVVTLDLLGHGASDRPRQGDVSLLVHMMSLRRVLDAAGVDAAVIVGHSAGGALALAFAMTYPERSRGLVLIAGGGLGERVSGPIGLLCGKPWSRPMVRLLGLRPVAPLAGRIVGRVAGRGAGRGIARSLAMFRDPGTRRVVLALMSAQGDAVSWLRDVADKPVLLLWGDRDGVTPIADAHRALEVLPDARLEVFDGGGHFAFRQHPELVARHVSALAVPALTTSHG